jgi:hypothetical protein
MNKLDRFCEAIMAFEGWEPGSRSYRNCNPGNLRRSVIQAGTAGGYALLDRFAHGWGALVADVSSKCSGRTATTLTPASTILEFFRVYAPSSDNNHPETYAKFVAARAGLDINTQIGSLMGPEP